MESPVRTGAAGVVLVVVLAAACGSQEVAGPAADAIISGTYDATAYPNVGALLYDFRGDGLDAADLVCTGTYVGLRRNLPSQAVFLTAAHCLAWLPAGSPLAVSFQPNLNGAVSGIVASGYVFDPAYGHDRGNPHDLAVVFLPAAAVSSLTPAALPAEGALDAMSRQGGLRRALFVNVGYGASARRTGRPGGTYPNKRLWSLAPFMGLTRAWLGLLTNTRATGQGGDCYGDSGGPKFLEGGTTVFATVSWGDIPCRATSWSYRLDTPSARAFLGTYLTLP
jgi:hypothetical protein